MMCEILKVTTNDSDNFKQRKRDGRQIEKAADGIALIAKVCRHVDVYKFCLALVSSAKCRSWPCRSSRRHARKRPRDGGDTPAGRSAWATCMAERQRLVPPL